MGEVRAGMEINDREISDLFSVDAEAHLQKLAACMFPTPALLPVELVRAALKRNASSVAVEAGRGRLVIEDDGEGIPDGPWRDLACALDRGRGAAEREAAIRALQDVSRPGIGLLAVFVPGAEVIRIESSDTPSMRAMEVTGGRVRFPDTQPGLRGTRIAITRRAGPVESEKMLLKELCAAVSRRVTLNGREIEKKPLLRRALVREQLPGGPGREPAIVAIPARGDACRIWLLDQRIPWQAFTNAPHHGLVFEAALESGTMPSESEIGRLAAAAHKLYQWLAEHYLSFPPGYQERIEELLFNKARSGSDLGLLSSFAPFRLWRSKQRLTLEEVRRKAARDTLYAMPPEGNLGRLLGHHQEALVLTPLQKDFLLNHIGLSLVTPSAAIPQPGRLAAWISWIQKKASFLTARLPRPLLRPIAPERLSASENLFCREMERHWQERHPRPPRIPLAVAMAAGRGLSPAALRNGRAGTMLFLRRRHPLVRRALECVAQDRANVELAFAALAPKRLLTEEIQ